MPGESPRTACAGYTATSSSWIRWQRQAGEVSGVGREDLVAVGGQEHHRSIDHVARDGPSQQRSRSPPQRLIEGGDLDADEQPACPARAKMSVGGQLAGC